MSRNHDPAEAAHADRDRARREHAARERLLALGVVPPVRPSAVDLVQLAVTRSADLDAEGVLSALTLLPGARAELEGLESALLFIARGAGLTWAQIAEALGFNSPQACQQWYTRLTARQEADT